MDLLELTKQEILSFAKLLNLHISELALDLSPLGNVSGYIVANDKKSWLPKVNERDFTTSTQFKADSEFLEWPVTPANDFEFWLRRHLMRVKFNQWPDYRKEVYLARQDEMANELAVSHSKALFAANYHGDLIQALP